MTESPEQRVARLEAELAQAKVDALQKELAAAQAGVDGHPRGPEHLTPPVQLTKAGDGDVPPSTWLPDSGSRRYVPASTWLPDSGASPSRLAPGPREVPWVFKLVVFPFRFWTLFELMMVSVTPIALWIFIPISGAIAGGLTFLVLTFLMLRRRQLCHDLMKWGEVATITNTDLLSVGSYYSGTTYQNVRIAQAHGWKVTRKWYSGPGYKTRVHYQVGSGKGTLVIRGLAYEGGVILADPRHPDRALCVSSFPYDIEPDNTGNWVGTLPNRVLVSSMIMTLIVLGWTAGMILLFTHQAMGLDGLIRR